MNFREATTEDLGYVAKHSISHGNKEYPDSVDFVYALEHEGNVLGIGGFKLLNPSTAWCWMDWTPLALEHKIAMYRTAKEYMEKFTKQLDIKLLLAAVREHFTEAVRTVTHLGFEKTIILPGFFGDEDAFLYILEVK